MLYNREMILNITESSCNINVENSNRLGNYS